MTEQAVSSQTIHRWYVRPVLFVGDVNRALRFYIDKEKGKLVPALQRYNGSYGKPDYPYLVLEALNKKWYRS